MTNRSNKRRNQKRKNRRHGRLQEPEVRTVGETVIRNGQRMTLPYNQIEPESTRRERLEADLSGVLADMRSEGSAQLTKADAEQINEQLDTIGHLDDQARAIRNAFPRAVGTRVQMTREQLNAFTGQDDLEEEDVEPGSYTEQLVEAMARGEVDTSKPMNIVAGNMITPAFVARKAARKEAVGAIQMDTWDRAPGWVCPRCTGDVPKAGKRGRYPGAVSRTDNWTEICSECGDAEGIEDMTDSLTPQDDWPVAKTPRAASWEAQRLVRSWPMMPYPGPKDLPQLRLHFLDRWVDGGPFQRVVHWRNPLDDHEEIARQERATISDATLWWVNEDMVTLCEAAAKTVTVKDENRKLRAIDVPLPGNQKRGLVCLQTPWVGQDAGEEAEHVKVHAFTWSTQKIRGISCLCISLYEYVDYAAGLTEQQMRMMTGTGLINNAISEPVGRLRGGEWILLGRTDWPMQEQIDCFDTFAATDLQEQAMLEDRRWIVAFAGLVNSKLAGIESSHVPNHQRKQAKRAGHPLPEKAPSTIRLVRLREVYKTAAQENDGEEPTEGGKRQYSHRWLVGWPDGNWAWRRCGPKHSQRRLVFIAPYPKGPDDKPLIIKETVRQVVR